MSGDVQPRKRKDKRRKKEGTSLGAVHEPVISPKYRRSESEDLKIFDVPDQGEKIHVQNEHGVGGNICVKIIFFCLFGLLVGAVGLIYIHSQGSTDVDLPTIEESRFAEYFTGWLDDSTDDHEHETHDKYINHDDHDENDEHDEHDEHEDHDDHNEHDDENENEEDESPEQVSDPIYRLFGLQSDDNNDIESDAQSKEFIETETRQTEDANENEDEAEEDEGVEEQEDEEQNEKEEEEEEEDEGVEEQEDEEQDEKEDEEEDGEEEEDMENDMDNINGGKDKAEHEEDDAEEEEEDSGVYLNEHNDENEENDDDDNDDDNDDDDDDDDDLSQMDEEDEEKYVTSQVKKNVKRWWEETPAERKMKVSEDDVGDNSDENEEKELSAEEQLEEDNEDEVQKHDMEDRTEVENEDRQDKDDVEKGEPKFTADEDDLGFDEIEISEEDLGTDGDVMAEKDQDEEDENRFNEESFDEETRKESGIDEETEADTEGGGGGVAIKLGVGIALIIVAHLVLVKKWKSMNSVPSDENVATETETPSEKKVIENLHSSAEPVISRRQTLVPENVCLSDEPDEEDEEEDEEEEECIEDDDAYSEEDRDEEEYKKDENWETFEKPSWRIGKAENEEECDDVDNEKAVEYDDEYEEEDAEELEDEQEQEEEDEEEVDDEEVNDEEEEQEYEEEDAEEEEDVEDDKDVLRKKLLATIPDKREEEVKETVPTPPPRSRSGRGPQEVEDNLVEFQEGNLVKETTEYGAEAVDEVNTNSVPEDKRTPESNKVGSEDEWFFRQELDFADEQIENNPKAAVNAYDRIISKKPTAIRALIGRARALDHWAEKEKSNAYLKQAINAYKTVLFNHAERLDDDTYVKLAERCIERMRFAGNFVSAIEVHKALILKYPNTPKYRNGLAVTYLMLNKIPQARVLLNETLNLWPNNGFALVHYGFILKTSDNNMEEGAKKLMAGIQTREEGVIDGMFFFHLGDALNRLGREKEAMKWYELGVKEGLFLSKYQRSLYNVNRLKGQPWWTKEETTYQDFFKKLEDNWREIRREGLELLNSRGVNLFKEEAENLKDTGDWKQLDLYFRGRKQANCNKAPVTCALVSSFKPASTCTRGQIKFSVMLPNTHVWPHCGPTNCRLRSHLGLVVPKKTFIRVAEETRSWQEGKFIIFDDSFEHEVWHNGTGPRLVLIVDVWHPELTNHERRVLSPI